MVAIPSPLPYTHIFFLFLFLGGGQIPPDMQNMSQAEITSMLKEAMSSVS